MPSETFTLVHRAILDRQQLVFRYSGFVREVCPHILGHKLGADGAREALLAYQFGGGSHQKAQACVDRVYVDVNEAVPNQPGRRRA